MYPQSLSEHVESAAERMLYQQFKEQLPDSFIIMHSVKWLMRDRSHFDRDGEIDFLIVHPKLGLLIMEVKGGGIRIDGPSGQWFSTDRHGHEQLIKNPFDQARKNLYDLREKLMDAPETRPYKYRMQRGVAFPNVNVGRTDIGLFGDRDLIIDSTDLNRLEAAVRRVMGTPGERDALGDDAMRALIDTVAPSTTLDRIGLLGGMIMAEEQIAQLTENQFLILELLRNRPRAAIHGCAGAGKTMLAMEKARLLANENFSVLFTCFNKNLANWARERFQQDARTAHERITVAHYHGLAVELCKRAGVALPSLNQFSTAVERAAYFDDILPEKMLEAIPLVPVRFDAIIADEGQDFAELWWITLLDLLKDREHSILYIFYDDNQRIYNREIALPVADLAYPLPHNLRNTNKIHETVLRYYRGMPLPTSRGPVGSIPTIVPVSPGREKEALRGVVAELLTQEQIGARNIVVLTPRGVNTSDFREGDRIGNITLTWDKHPGPGQVQICSIHAFKGLESPVIILAEMDRLDAPQRDYLLYVATSRARNLLYVLGNLPAPAAGSTRREDRWAVEDVA